MMSDIDEVTLAKLAREMSMNIRPYTQIFADYGITEEDYYEISKIEFYARAKEQFTLEWNATLGTADRLKFQSQAGLEQLLPSLVRRALDPKEHLNDAADVAKLLAKNAGIGEGKNDGKPTAERFQITINLGADVNGKPVVEKYDKSVAIDANDIIGTGYEKKPLKLSRIVPNESEMDVALESLMQMED